MRKILGTGVQIDLSNKYDLVYNITLLTCVTKQFHAFSCLYSRPCCHYSLCFSVLHVTWEYFIPSIDSQQVEPKLWKVEPKSLLTIYIILTGILGTSHNFCLWSMGLMNGLVPLIVTLVHMITFTLLTSLFTKTTRWLAGNKSPHCRSSHKRTPLSSQIKGVHYWGWPVKYNQSEWFSFVASRDVGIKRSLPGACPTTNKHLKWKDW